MHPRGKCEEILQYVQVKKRIPQKWGWSGELHQEAQVQVMKKIPQKCGWCEDIRPYIQVMKKILPKCGVKRSVSTLAREAALFHQSKLSLVFCLISFESNVSSRIAWARTKILLIRYVLSRSTGLDKSVGPNGEEQPSEAWMVRRDPPISPSGEEQPSEAWMVRRDPPISPSGEEQPSEVWMVQRYPPVSPSGEEQPSEIQSPGRGWRSHAMAPKFPELR